MSRIGKKPIPLPVGVKYTVAKVATPYWSKAPRAR